MPPGQVSLCSKLLYSKSLTFKHKWKLKVLVAQSCPTLCTPMDCRLPGSSVHGISQARILELGGISFSRGSSWPRDRTCFSCLQVVCCIEGRFFTDWATRKAKDHLAQSIYSKPLVLCLPDFYPILVEWNLRAFHKASITFQVMHENDCFIGMGAW